jgi:hypothetical protein
MNAGVVLAASPGIVWERWEALARIGDLNRLERTTAGAAALSVLRALAAT